jgi:hypothetical protein
MMNCPRDLELDEVDLETVTIPIGRFDVDALTSGVPHTLPIITRGEYVRCRNAATGALDDPFPVSAGGWALVGVASSAEAAVKFVRQNRTCGTVVSVMRTEALFMIDRAVYQSSQSWLVHVDPDAGTEHPLRSDADLSAPFVHVEDPTGDLPMFGPIRRHRLLPPLDGREIRPPTISVVRRKPPPLVPAAVAEAERSALVITDWWGQRREIPVLVPRACVRTDWLLLSAPHPWGVAVTDFVDPDDEAEARIRGMAAMAEFDKWLQRVSPTMPVDEVLRKAVTVRRTRMRYRIPLPTWMCRDPESQAGLRTRMDAIRETDAWMVEPNDGWSERHGLTNHQRRRSR